MYNCTSCNSSELIKRGIYFNKTDNISKQRYQCVSCKTQFSVELPRIEESNSIVSKSKKYVITSVQNDTKINKEFYNSLIGYCKYHNAELIILRTKYKLETDSHESYNVDSKYLLTTNITIADKIKIFGNLNLMPTLVSPLSGMDSLSAGYTCIFGSASYQMRTLPVNADQHPIIMTTTGCISYPNNSDTKTGQKADYNHSFSALVLELDEEQFHLRLLNADSTGGFYDLTNYYSNDIVTNNHRIDAIILGDVHVEVADKTVINATYNNSDSIVNILKPKQVVLHDLMDFHQLQSHHNKNNYLKRFALYVSGNDNVKDELDRTVQFVIDNTPDFVEENLIISSNHLDHLEHFLNGVDIKTDYKNSILYHFLMYKMLVAISEKREVNAFQLYFEEFCDSDVVYNKTRFLGREDSVFINDILVSSHGDKGTGGSRFAPSMGKKMPYPMVVGHIHSPYVEGGLWATGTCTGKLDYAKGVASGWMNSHVVIYPNGTRTHINIIHGKWRL